MISCSNVERSRQQLVWPPCDEGSGLCLAIPRIRPFRHAVARYTTAATLLLGLASILEAQGPEAVTETQPPSAQDKEDVDLARLVDLCAEKLQLHVQYEPGQLTGTVALPLMEGRSDLELWTLANRALVSRGLTTIQMPGEESITVV